MSACFNFLPRCSVHLTGLSCFRRPRSGRFFRYRCAQSVLRGLTWLRRQRARQFSFECQLIGVLDRWRPPFSRPRRQSVYVMPIRLPELQILDMLKAPSNSPSAPSSSSSSKADFYPDLVAVDNSETATGKSSRGKWGASRWRGSKNSLMRRSEKGKAQVTAGAATESSDFTVTPLPGADFDPDFVLSETSEASTDELSTITRDAPGERGSTRSLMSGSEKPSAEVRSDGGTESSNSGSVSLMPEEPPRQELASRSKEEENTREGALKLHFGRDRSTTHSGEFPIAKSPLKEQQPQQDEHKRGRNRALKGIISVRQRVKQLGKTKPDEFRRKVVVNGVPIKDTDVKKAEESAGPIHPGNYWYDVLAGFWGVEPGPCLGIIPPCIRELNSPMSRSCADGNTDILINGRELHEKDLQRLAFRGLPTTPGWAYSISIDGRVVNESSRKYVTGLGMLAPSLEKTGRGAGMYKPSVR